MSTVYFCVNSVGETYFHSIQQYESVEITFSEAEEVIFQMMSNSQISFKGDNVINATASIGFRGFKFPVEVPYIEIPSSRRFLPALLWNMIFSQEEGRSLIKKIWEAGNALRYEHERRKAG